MKPKNLGKITSLRLTTKLHDELPGLAVGQGGYQTAFGRIRDSTKMVDGKPVTYVNAKDMKNLKEWAQRDDAGSWQDWAREALIANGLLS